MGADCGGLFARSVSAATCGLDLRMFAALTDRMQLVGEAGAALYYGPGTNAGSSAGQVGRLVGGLGFDLDDDAQWQFLVEGGAGIAHVDAGAGPSHWSYGGDAALSIVDRVDTIEARAALETLVVGFDRDGVSVSIVLGAGYRF